METQKHDLYEWYDVAIASLFAKMELPEELANIVKRFDGFMRAKRQVKGTRYQKLKAVIDFLEWFKRDPKEATREDLELYVAHLNEKYLPSTVSGRIGRLKVFFNWYFRLPRRQFPDCIAWITPQRVERRIEPSDLLMPQDCARLIEALPKLWQKAAIELVYHLGCRLGELLSLRLCDIERTSYGFDVWVRAYGAESNTKKHFRLVPLVGKFPYLETWLLVHPLKDSPEAPLFVTSKRSLPHISTLQKILKTVAKRLNLRINIYPHLFRHTAATRDAALYPETVVKAKFGWTPSSNMLDRYIHLSPRTIKARILRAHGISVEEEELESPLLLPLDQFYVEAPKSRD